MHRFLALGLFLTGCLYQSASCHAMPVDIASYTAGHSFSSFSSGEYIGSTFVDGAPGVQSNIRFSYLSSTGDPFAVGTLYLFSQPYTGLSTELTSATPGVLGSAEASSGVYAFSQSLVLTQGTTYYAYEVGDIPNSALGTGGGNNGSLLARPGESYEAFTLASFDFAVTGEIVPELDAHNAAIPLALALCSLCLVADRRRLLAASGSLPSTEES